MIKKILKKFYLRFIAFRKRNKSKFKNLNEIETFEKIYKENLWESNESISGFGSELKQTEKIIKELNTLILNYKIKNILDLPCGDFNWMQKVNLEKVNYIGGDIVENLIEINNKKFSTSKNINFKKINLIKDKIDNFDLIINRDCLVHLSNKDILLSLENIKKSNSKYLLTTNFFDVEENLDIITGDWRKINLLKKPFNLKNPILIINENSVESDGKYKDKSLLLFEIKNI